MMRSYKSRNCCSFSDWLESRALLKNLEANISPLLEDCSMNRCHMEASIAPLHVKISYGAYFYIKKFWKMLHTLASTKCKYVSSINFKLIQFKFSSFRSLQVLKQHKVIWLQVILLEISWMNVLLRVHATHQIKFPQKHHQWMVADLLVGSVWLFTCLKKVYSMANCCVSCNLKKNIKQTDDFKNNEWN